MSTTMTNPNVETLSLSQLVALYNELTGEKVKKFSDRKSGIRRVQAAMDKAGGIRVAKAETIATAYGASPAKVKEVAAKARPASTLDGPARRKLISFPEAKAIKPHRTGTKRSQIIDLLRKGATIQQVMDATGWGYKDAYDGIKLLNVYLGHGLEENVNGVITLTGTAPMGD